MKYKTELKKLQADLVHLQKHVKEHGLKVVVLFEGRDAAGKGGVIKRITERLDPNHYRVVAKGKPTDEEEKQWYFQRWVKEMPREGEIVLFDRSWYTRAGVESVMGFASKEQVTSFLKDCPSFEKTLTRQGVIVIKYWLSITQKTQEQRFHQRLNDLTKQWKLSPMDLKSRDHWHDYTRAKERMFKRTHSKHCPWHIVDTNNKKQGRLAVIKHLLSVIPFERTEHEPKKLPHIYPCTEHNPEFDHLKVN
jgi:polyphosphate kinase 2